QAPFVTVLLRRHVVLRAQMALQRLEALVVLEANQIFRRHRLLYRHGRLGRLERRLGAAARHPHQRGMELADQVRDFRGLGRIVAEIGRYDIGGQFDASLAGGIDNGSTFGIMYASVGHTVRTVSNRAYTSVESHTTWRI